MISWSFDGRGNYFKMIKQLKFIQDAVAKNDTIPLLTHFLIRDRRISGFNGNMSLSCPIEIDVNIAPKASQFVKAIEACKGTVSIVINNKGRLVVSSGTFKTFVDCLDEKLIPSFDIGGEYINLTEPILPALAALEPFIALDNSRPWACGILLRGQSAYSTNNIVIMQYWLGYHFPKTVNIPHTAVKQLLKIGVEPVGMQLDDKQVTFYYNSGTYLTTAVKAETWPDVEALLNRQDNAQPVPPEFFTILEELEPFIARDKKVYFNQNSISTKDSELEGTIIETEFTPGKGCFNMEQLLSMKKIVKKFDFDNYPNPCAFHGDKLRGLIVGIKI